MKMNKFNKRALLFTVAAALISISMFVLCKQPDNSDTQTAINAYKDTTYEEVFKATQDGDKLFLLACDSSDETCKQAIEWAKTDLTKEKDVYFIDTFKYLNRINKTEDASERTAATVEFYNLMENLRYVAWPMLLDVEDTKVIESWNSLADNDANSIDALSFEQIKKEVTKKYAQE